ncbi:capsid size determination protein [Pectobacterium polaris]|uniref:capsid size determination protein n=1 Tax=Pectobacterium polaris TaxID=2042057 RepID=UPI0021C655B5|nr:capsid size determination protein [Pectobacterium polaris]MCU1793230.1 capsid size determination protein [Pectobacterium polaris]
MSQKIEQIEKSVTPPDVLKKTADEYQKRRAEHFANASELDNIDTAIARAKEQKANTESENQLSDTDWRARFLAARGEMTEELKNQQLQRLAQRELAQEYDGLLAQLEIDQLKQKAKCHHSAKECRDAYKTALFQYANWEFNQAINNISEDLIRAIKLYRHMYDVTTSEFTEGLAYQNPDNRVMNQVIDHLMVKSNKYQFNMDNEPELSSLRLYQPALPHSDFPPVSTLCQNTKFWRELKEKEEALKTRGQKV